MLNANLYRQTDRNRGCSPCPPSKQASKLTSCLASCHDSQSLSVSQRVSESDSVNTNYEHTHQLVHSFSFSSSLHTPHHTTRPITLWQCIAQHRTVTVITSASTAADRQTHNWHVSWWCCRRCCGCPRRWWWWWELFWCSALFFSFSCPRAQQCRVSAAAERQSVTGKFIVEFSVAEAPELLFPFPSPRFLAILIARRPVSPVCSEFCTACRP